MYLTLEILEKHGACGEGVAWFKRHYPEGGELIDVINNPKAAPHLLHWGFNNLNTSLEEQEAYRAKVGIDCGEMNFSIYESDNVKNSYYISRCSNVENGQYIFRSKNITNSTNVTGSELIEDSDRIYDSSFVFDSQKVLYSKNVTSSNRVINSDYVLNSNDISNGSAITNSHFVNGFTLGSSKNINDSWFIFQGQNLSNCLFCSQLKDAEYCLFNKPINKIHYDNIIRQLQTILGNEHWELVQHWGGGTIPLDMPQLKHNITHHYRNFPQKFWNWVTTLPNYDPMVLYNITYLPELLD